MTHIVSKANRKFLIGDKKLVTNLVVFRKLYHYIFEHRTIFYVILCHFNRNCHCSALD